LRRHGYEVGAVDAEARNLAPSQIVDLLRQGGYGVLGVSTTTVSFHRATELAATVKRALPGIPIVVGGPHVSSQPSHPLQFEAFDYAIRNEGEETLRETLEMLETGSDPSAVAGLIYRRDGRSVVNPPRPYIADLDSLPFPAYDLIPDLGVYTPPPFNYKRRPVANVITSRGCPNQCTFCENTTFGRTIRMRSAEGIVDEIETLINRYGVKEIAFVDDTFTVRPKRVYEIFEAAARRGLRFSWTCMSRVNTVDEELLRYMRDNGCWYVSFGIESGDERILKEIRKNIRLEDVRRVVETCARLGIWTKGFFIVGHPGESVETIEKTIGFARELKLDHVVVTLNTPMPGTYQHLHAHEFGQLDVSSWTKFNYWQPVFVPAGMSRELILRKHAEFLRRFYLRPGLLLRHARALAADPNTYRQLWNLGVDLLCLIWQAVRKPSREALPGGAA
jgi:radical SAM superfamily enzyme YgiQ (UPF0313 family)